MAGSEPSQPASRPSGPPGLLRAGPIALPPANRRPLWPQSKPKPKPKRDLDLEPANELDLKRQTNQAPSWQTLGGGPKVPPPPPPSSALESATEQTVPLCRQLPGRLLARAIIIIIISVVAKPAAVPLVEKSAREPLGRRRRCSRPRDQMAATTIGRQLRNEPPTTVICMPPSNHSDHSARSRIRSQAWLGSAARPLLVAAGWRGPQHVGHQFVGPSAAADIWGPERAGE